MLALTCALNWALPTLKTSLNSTSLLNVPLPCQWIRWFGTIFSQFRRIAAEVFSSFEIFCLALAGKFRRPIECRLIVNDFSNILELGVSKRKLPDAALQVGRVEGERVEAWGMSDGFAVRLVVVVPWDVGLFGVLEALELGLEGDDLLFETAQQVALLVHFNIKIIRLESILYSPHPHSKTHKL